VHKTNKRRSWPQRKKASSDDQGESTLRRAYMPESQNSPAASDGPMTGNAVKNYCRSNSYGKMESTAASCASQSRLRLRSSTVLKGQGILWRAHESIPISKASPNSLR
jgi:hypothetical protein